MPVLIALLAGAVFGAGLTISDMINPARVLNFLDIAGQWDPTLIFVMAGALAVTAPGYRLAMRRPEPFFEKSYSLPTLTRVDAPLVAGSALFGVGWGLAGICPGPAIAGLVSLEPKMFVFAGALVAGMLGARLLRNGGLRQA